MSGFRSWSKQLGATDSKTRMTALLVGRQLARAAAWTRPWLRVVPIARACTAAARCAHSTATGRAATALRTHTCNQVRSSILDSPVTLTGWLASKRSVCVCLCMCLCVCVCVCVCVCLSFFNPPLSLPHSLSLSVTPYVYLRVCRCSDLMGFFSFHPHALHFDHLACLPAPG